MGKHDKKKKKKKQDGVKGTGQEKTELKTEKNAKKKALKMKGDDEEDIEKILEQIKKMDAAKVAINEEVVPHPSPRIHATFTPHPTKDNELILFGGEFFDGELTFVYNDLFRYNIDKKEWKKVSSPNSPPPRCSHQAVTYKNFLYVFGGEFTSPSQNQFYHYKDLWRLNLDNFSWEQIKDTKGAPTARSGHRMIRWKNKLLLFGGFYDTIAETKYFNDLYILDLDSLKWTKVEKTAVGQVPKPRSGFIMTLFENTLILYGGYSKEKVTKYGEAKGVIHTDLWSINLNNAPNLTWERMKRSGIPPTPRSGMSAILDKRRLLVFGGVFDEETDTKMNSIFYNDLYALYMDSKRWFSLKLHIKGEKKKRAKKVKDNKAQATNTETEEKSDSEDEYQESQLEETTSDFVEDFEDEAQQDKNKDEEEDQDESDQEDVEEDQYDEEEVEREDSEDSEEEDRRRKGKKKKSSSKQEKEKEKKDNKQKPASKKEDKKKGKNNKDKEKDKKSNNKKEDKKKKDEKPAMKDKSKSKKELPLTLSPQQQTKSPTTAAVAKPTTTATNAGPSSKPAVAKESTENVTAANASTPVENASLIPSPRINSMLCISNNTLYMFGGSYEVNNREITLNDLYSLNLNKMDTFVCLRPSDVVEWKGEEEEDDDDDDEDDEDDSEDDEEESGSSDSEEDEDNDDSESEDSEKEAVEEKPKEKKKQVKSKGYIEELKARLQEFQKDGQPTANAGETLRDFFDRTKDYWLKAAYDQATKEQESSTVNIHHDSKSLIRNGFPLAELRYKEMKPLLEEFEEIEKESKRQAELLTIKQKGAKPKR